MPVVSLTAAPSHREMNKKYEFPDRKETTSVHSAQQLRQYQLQMGEVLPGTLVP
ncbi:MAG: hypothetical protein ACUVTH_12265 [Thermogutta sp.]